ncbi:EamA family transporter [Pullulanibacillus sp. KACC 23026]|uniref:DMT family transporter n=1 Tax=Pullulanibacillus sp. KACC 23026 TaxID=3028315 RepID=UPI0023B01507|nr:EamA family transporter [Pullulanibacillus sp. KACC 23026]WEG14880.1 EamA family transporter [Pullulanibacillus sp. KACC 23026]
MIKPNRMKGFILVIIGTIFWGIGGTVSNELFKEYSIDVNWLVTTRLLVAGFLLLAIKTCGNNRSQIIGVWKHKRTASQLIIFGLIGMLGVQYTYMAAINYGNAAVATLLQNLSPVMIIIYLILRKQTVLTKRDLMIVGLSIVGCFFLLTNGSLTRLSVSTPAVFWGILSGVAAAFYTLYAVNLLKKYDSLVIVGWAMIIGGVALSFIHPAWQIHLTAIPLRFSLYLAFVILFGTMIAFWFFIESLKSLSPKETSLLGSLEPLSAVLATVFWLKEPFGAFQWVGTVCIFGMLLLLAFNKKTISSAPIQKVPQSSA